MQTEFYVKHMPYTPLIELILKLTHIQSKMFKLYPLDTTSKIDIH